jgi:hypothetical protein
MKSYRITTALNGLEMNGVVRREVYTTVPLTAETTEA